MSACEAPRPNTVHVLSAAKCFSELRHRSDGVPVDLRETLVNQVGDDLILNDLTIESLANWADGRTDTQWSLPIFWGLARAFKSVRVGEIGMRNAVSTLAFCLGARDVGGHVYSMDIDECLWGLRNIRGAGLETYHTFIHGDSACMEFPEPLDILFIDGDHTYQDVSTDLQKHGAMVKKGGLILFHDPVSCFGVEALCKEVGACVLPMGTGLGILPC